MATLSDIKMPTREEAENFINTVKDTSDYLFEGWGSKFKLEDFTESEPGTYYPGEGYIGFGSVTITSQHEDPTKYDEVLTRISNSLIDVKLKIANGLHGRGNGMNLCNIKLTGNGTYVAPEGYDGFKRVVVDIPSAPRLQAKTASTNGYVTFDEGYQGLSSVTVQVPEKVLKSKVFEENGHFTPSDADGWNEIYINVPATAGGYEYKDLVVNKPERKSYPASYVIPKEVTSFFANPETVILPHQVLVNPSMLEEVSLESGHTGVQYVRQGYFNETGITDISFAKNAELGSYAFSLCHNLSVISEPVIIDRGSINAFEWIANNLASYSTTVIDLDNVYFKDITDVSDYNSIQAGTFTGICNPIFTDTQQGIDISEDNAPDIINIPLTAIKPEGSQAIYILGDNTFSNARIKTFSFKNKVAYLGSYAFSMNCGAHDYNDGRGLINDTFIITIQDVVNDGLYNDNGLNYPVRVFEGTPFNRLYLPDLKIITPGMYAGVSLPQDDDRETFTVTYPEVIKIMDDQFVMFPPCSSITFNLPKVEEIGRNTFNFSYVPSKATKQEAGTDPYKLYFNDITKLVTLTSENDDTNEHAFSLYEEEVAKSERTVLYEVYVPAALKDSFSNNEAWKKYVDNGIMEIKEISTTKTRKRSKKQ